MMLQVKFRKMTLEENVDIIKWAYFANNSSLDIHNYTIKCFPQLADIDKSLSED